MVMALTSLLFWYFSKMGWANNERGASIKNNVTKNFFIAVGLISNVRNH
jgi:hypothetical protein